LKRTQEAGISPVLRPSISIPRRALSADIFSPDSASVSLALLVSNGLIVGKVFQSHVVGTVLLSLQQPA